LGKKTVFKINWRKKLKEDLKFCHYPVDWKSIMKDQNSNTNVTLSGDEIEVIHLMKG
jgi:hypothetical protein